MLTSTQSPALFAKARRSLDEVTDYISAKSFLLLRRDTLETSGTSGITLPVKEIYSDYRMIEGRMIPFKSVTTIPTITHSSDGITN